MMDVHDGCHSGAAGCIIAMQLHQATLLITSSQFALVLVGLIAWYTFQGTCPDMCTWQCWQFVAACG
jgi:hypothetical protein